MLNCSFCWVGYIDIDAARAYRVDLTREVVEGARSTACGSVGPRLEGTWDEDGPEERLQQKINLGVVSFRCGLVSLLRRRRRYPGCDAAHRAAFFPW